MAKGLGLIGNLCFFGMGGAFIAYASSLLSSSLGSQENLRVGHCR
jgi:hypothetical protein